MHATFRYEEIPLQPGRCVHVKAYLSLAVQSRKEMCPDVVDHCTQREQGRVDTADHCEARAAKLGNIRSRAYEVCNSVIAASLRPKGLPG